MAEVLYSEALELLRHEAAAQGLFGTERVALERATGRVLAERLGSRELIPAFNNSAVDGFALRAAEVSALQRSGPARFKVLGTISAGDLPPASVPAEAPGAEAPRTWEIMTGAPFPPGFDCSVKVEHTEVLRDLTGRAREIVVRDTVTAGDALRPAGEDFQPGGAALLPGIRLAPQHVLAAAALGGAELTVRRRPRIALVSTGKELLAHTAPSEPGRVRNSTLPFLRAAIAELGWELASEAVVADDARELWTALKHALAQQPDVIITTGGVSMGIHDHVATVAADLGARAAFHRVAIRPGKPILFATFPTQKTALFGLPGNPVSTVVGLRFFVEPFLRARLGLAAETPLRARLSARTSKPKGLRCFYKAHWDVSEGASRVKLLPGQASFMISPLLSANAWAVLPEAETALDEGHWLDVYPLNATGDFS